MLRGFLYQSKIMSRLSRALKSWPPYNLLRIRWHLMMNAPKARRVRRKEVINVIFVVSNLSMWKTESLYLRMREHPRFHPVIRIVSLYANPVQLQTAAAEYMEEKGYEYRVLDDTTPLQDGFRADIIFYMQPYDGTTPRIHRYSFNHNALICYIAYGIRSTLHEFSCNTMLQNIAWQQYFENVQAASDIAHIMTNSGVNSYVTGHPLFDMYYRPRSEYSYPWKPQPQPVKRIIYAPHFSIEPDSVLKYGTFLKNGEFMLEMAKKYRGKCQFVFKPHPLLREHLTAIWGKERTDTYYAEWDMLDNGQAEFGQHVDLFMTSDAMIHDSSSFTIEYFFSGNPALYLLHSLDDGHGDDLNTCTLDAFRLHRKAVENEEIERFILDVIEGKDTNRDARKAFYNKYLANTDGSSACDNIIASILGTKDFRMKKG